MADRKPYDHLTPEQQDAIHYWLRLHRAEPIHTPEDPLIEFDAAAGEWRIEQRSRRGGRTYVGPDGEMARHVLRRVHRADLPWPEMTLTDVVRRHHHGRGPSNVHLRVAPNAYADVPRQPLPDPAPWAPNPWAGLFGIPAVIDDDLGDDVWQLVDNRTRKVLARGRLIVDPPRPTQFDTDRAAWRASYLMSAAMQARSRAAWDSFVAGASC